MLHQIPADADSPINPKRLCRVTSPPRLDHGVQTHAAEEPGRFSEIVSGFKFGLEIRLNLCGIVVLCGSRVGSEETIRHLPAIEPDGKQCQKSDAERMHGQSCAVLTSVENRSDEE